MCACLLQRVYAMDVVDELMVVGTADRQIQVCSACCAVQCHVAAASCVGSAQTWDTWRKWVHVHQLCTFHRPASNHSSALLPLPQVFNLGNPGAVYKSLQSPLKYQTRCISCFPDKVGRPAALVW